MHGTTGWSIRKTNGNVSGFILRNLSANTTYDWRIASSDSANGITATGTYADSITFTTASSVIAGDNNEEENLSVNDKYNVASLSISPNPATNFFIINLKNNKQEKINAILYDMNGKAVWSSGSINADAINGKKVMVNQFGNGAYYLKITNDKGMMLGAAKLMINK